MNVSKLINIAPRQYPHQPCKTPPRCDNEAMVGAVFVTILALGSAALIFGALLASHRPDEGWRQEFRASLRAVRQQPSQWSAKVDVDAEVGDLRTLIQLSEPGNAYTSPDELNPPR